MKIELKNIKHAEFASQETNNYQASLYIDGKKIGTVGNDGIGGCDYFWPDHPIGENRRRHADADAWCRENLPPLTLGEWSSPTDLEAHCATLLQRFLARRDLQRQMKRSVLFILPGADGVQQVRFKGTRTIGQAHIDHVANKYPKAFVLNKHPVDEVLDTFLDHV